MSFAIRQTYKPNRLFRPIYKDLMVDGNNVSDIDKERHKNLSDLSKGYPKSAAMVRGFNHRTVGGTAHSHSIKKTSLGIVDGF